MIVGLPWCWCRLRRWYVGYLFHLLSIDQQQVLMVNFVTFGPSSVDFFVYAFTRTVDWQTYHRVKQDVLLKIAGIIEQHGAQIAFPTQTLHVQPEPIGPAS